MRTRHPGRGVDAEHHAQPPSEVDGKVGAVGALAEDRLRHHANPERDEHERAEKLRCRFPEHARDYAGGSEK